MQREDRVASVVEDDAAKWAVFALSSNRKNQSFFNYYGPRKLVVKDKPQDGMILLRRLGTLILR